MENIINFDDIVTKQKSNSQDQSTLYEFSRKYFDSIDRGEVHDFFISMFEDLNNGGATEVVLALTKIGNYLYEHDYESLVMQILTNPIPQLMDLADFYMYYCTNYSNSESVDDCVNFHFEGYPPVAIGLGMTVYNCLEISMHAHRYDEHIQTAETDAQGQRLYKEQRHI